MRRNQLANSIRSELIKFYRPSLFLTFSGSLTALSILLDFFYIKQAKKSGNIINLNQGFEMSILFLSVVALAVGASSIGNEYSQGTLKNILSRSPSRIKFLLGKFTAIAIFLTVLCLPTFLADLLFSMTMAAESSREHWLDHGVFIESLRALICTLFGMILFALFGFSLGLILRSSIMAISLGLFWALIMESAIGGMEPRMTRWLPAANFQNLAQSFSPGFPRSISYIHSMSVSAAYLLVFFGVALKLFLRRDVSQ